ncbi:hypothetical protein Lser_V15G28666 [Lactuca serriola]
MDPGSLLWPITEPRLQWYFLLGLVYSTITPILLPFIIFFFEFAYMFIHHMNTSQDSNLMPSIDLKNAISVNKNSEDSMNSGKIMFLRFAHLLLISWLWDVPAATKEDVNVVVDVAHKALKRNGGKEWASTSGAHHAKYLRAIDSKVGEKKSELAKLEAIDCGKPLEEAAWDMDDVAGCFDYNADLAEELDRKQNASVSLPMDTFKCHLIREPIGVVALITPSFQHLGISQNHMTVEILEVDYLFETEELGAEINELEKQRDKLETELKKVKNLLVVVNGRLRNATEEREQFDDANNQLLVEEDTYF